ncbi:hypothetical protein N7922_06750 [Kosakonia sp. ML.JS2a]|uniref:hypothetical protein n=1 Tax=Kosakonia sp. ML.JS2a TaxID=2980557 RepID=UPI0021DB493D|nr:hypothetical protein [Kosakonia sp. ML.JS2a]UXY12214.1 hypothetical protein N7922_06750 [Kosakonia sp. ML.JS2a]
MPITSKIEAKDFYKNLPSIEHETGDIWLNLPSWGIAKLNKCSGIVLTPACDLSQKKTETAFILPIIPLRDYLYSKAFYFDLWKEINSKIKNIGEEKSHTSRYSNPDTTIFYPLLENLEKDKKKKALYEQLKEYCNYISYVNLPMAHRNDKPSPNFEIILGKTKYEDILKKIFTNSYKSDVHFLPAFNNAGEYSAVPVHSVALFRHSYTVPIEVLDAAQSSSSVWWGDDRITLAASSPIAHFFDEWPIKASGLKDDFLSDLISRYLSMFMRLGSRDFTAHTIENFVTEIKGV